MGHQEYILGKNQFKVVEFTHASKHFQMRSTFHGVQQMNTVVQSLPQSRERFLKPSLGPLCNWSAILSLTPGNCSCFLSQWVFFLSFPEWHRKHTSIPCEVGVQDLRLLTVSTMLLGLCPLSLYWQHLALDSEDSIIRIPCCLVFCSLISRRSDCFWFFVIGKKVVIAEDIWQIFVWTYKKAKWG